MTDLFLLSEAQMHRIKPYFPLKDEELLGDKGYDAACCRPLTAFFAHLRGFGAGFARILHGFALGFRLQLLENSGGKQAAAR